MTQIQVELQSFMGSDREIAEVAWTSSTAYQNKKARTDEDVARIIKMLAELKHSVPFESVVFRFWIKMPISADRQHMTHRIASHSGMSGRYRTMPDEWQAVPDDVRDIAILLNEEWDNRTASQLMDEYNAWCEQTNAWYRSWLKLFKSAEDKKILSNSQYKRLREFFRGVLPQNNMTERVTVINLRSFANYQKLRNSEHAQPEIRRVAELMLECVEKANIAPIAVQALKTSGWEI